MKTTSLLFSLCLIPCLNLSFASEELETPCAAPTIQVIDTTFQPNLNGYFEFEVSFSVNGVSHWCIYNPATGNTVHSLDPFQYMQGFGDYYEPYIVYDIIAGACEGTRDTIYLIDAVNFGNPHHPPGDDFSDTSLVNPHPEIEGEFSDPDIIQAPFGQNNPIVNKESDDELKMKIYPNPTVDFIYMSAEFFENTSTLYFQMYDQGGTLILTQIITSNSPKIDVIGLPRGLYVYKFLNPNQTLKTGKVILN